MNYQSIESSEELPNSDQNGQSSESKARQQKSMVIIAITLCVLVCTALIVWQINDRPSNTAPVLVEQPFSNAELELRKNIQAIQERVDSLSDRVSEYKRSESSQQGLQQKFTQLSTSSQETGNVLYRQQGILEELALAVEGNVQRIAQLRQAQQSQNKSPPKKDSLNKLLLFQSPPFRLLTVEHWEGKPTAILELAGKIKTAQIGSYIARWKIISVNPVRRSIDVAYQNELSRIRTLEAGS